MRLPATVALATVLGLGAAYTLKGKSSPEPHTTSVYRIAEIPKADSARIARMSAQSLETIRPPAPVTPRRVATTTPPAATPAHATPAHAVPAVAKAKPKKKTTATRKAKAAPPKAKPKTAASHKQPAT